MIETAKLMENGAKKVTLGKGEILFHAGSEANFYYQVGAGSIKMITDSADGQEFIQGIFNAGDSFGEPPLFCDFLYPSTAIAIEVSTVIKLGKTQFFTMLKENFDIHLQFDKVLCQRLKYKSMILSDISFYDPEHRITNLLKYLKSNNSQDTEGGMIRNSKPYVIPFTRQQLADMSGLRVETVIRTVKKMQQKGKLKIVGRKISI
jgi:CRP-like cAMP-binding protein